MFPLYCWCSWKPSFFVIASTMLTKHSKQPTLGTVTIASHSLRIMRPLFNLQDGTISANGWTLPDLESKLTQHNYFTEEVLCDSIRFSGIIRLSTSKQLIFITCQYYLWKCFYVAQDYHCNMHIVVSRYLL